MTTRRALLGLIAGLPLAWKAMATEVLAPESEEEEVTLVEVWERGTGVSYRMYRNEGTGMVIEEARWT